MQSTTYKKTPFTKCLLIFFTRERKKYNFFEKLIQKKIQRNFIAYNNDKIIRAWYLSSKWPVCSSIVNQTTGGTSRTTLITFYKTNIFKYCALFCNKVAKKSSNKIILSIQIMGKYIFVLFRSFFHFKWRAKLVIF